MTRLDYNEDNFFGTECRGDRYDIYVDGDLRYSKVTDRECDRLCEDFIRMGYDYENIEVKES